MENVDHCVWHLATFGYLVIPFIPSDDIESTRGRFLDTARGFPEFQNVEKQFQFVAGGFSALGNPASFHNPFVREMRQKAYATHRRLFENSGLNGHALFDRMMLRQVFGSVSGVHRATLVCTSQRRRHFGLPNARA
jgi:hypothetical protein